jgi:two-component system chemotaxis sensor kinase CheA
VSLQKYIDIFAREAEEHLQSLRQGLMAIEKQGSTPELIHELLRNAHTIKGSAMMVGLEQISEVAHRMEDLFTELETGKRELLPGCIDVLLLATDTIEELTARVVAGDENKIEIDAIIEGLKNGELSQRSVANEKSDPVAGKGVDRRKTVRASVERLDILVNQLGELLIARQGFDDKFRQMDLLNHQLEKFMVGLRKVENCNAVKELHASYSRLAIELEQSTFALGYQAEELHGSAMQLRMMPLSTITEDLIRMTRDLAREQGKSVSLEIEGETLELDRVMLDEIKPMLMHMVRNSIDHGIETIADRVAGGKPEHSLIRLTARYEGGKARLMLSDDGRGIDPHAVRKAAVDKNLISQVEAESMSDEEAVYLILRPGFSTRAFVTDVSGRGVGMDVVKTNIDRIKGNLLIDSVPTQGTAMRLTFPLSMAVITGLLVESGDEKYAIPLNYVSEVLRLNDADILHELGREVVRVHGEAIPLFSLAGLLNPGSTDRIAGCRISAVMLHFRNRKIACLVARTIGEQDMVVKNMGMQLKRVEFISGATILGDGSPALILSVPDLFGGGLDQGRTRLKEEINSYEESQKKGKILVVDDSITTRTMEKNILEANGYEVTIAVSGFDALEKLAVQRFDLMVSDVEMPGMTGFELTRKVRQLEETKTLPVIICTSLATDEHKRLGMEVGAQAYIVKGNFDQGTLLDTVASLIA